VKSLPLKSPLSLLRSVADAGGDGVELPELVGCLLGKLASVMQNLFSPSLTLRQRFEQPLPQRQ